MEKYKTFHGVIGTLFLFFFIGSIHSSRLRNPTLCGSGTCDAGGKFNFSLNTQYIYNYDVDVSTLFQGTSGNKSTFHVRALVNLNFIAPCQGVLRVSNILLTEGYDGEIEPEANVLPKADNFAEALSKYPLRFEFSDGSINELCPDEEEPVWVLNFKRGVLSAFHNTMKRFDIDDERIETDVNGDCKTRYELRGAKGTELVISKSKNLNTCLNRFKYNTITQSVSYNFGSDFNSIPMVKSSHDCEFTIDHKIYNAITCREIHTFRPFARNGTGAQTIIRQTLMLASEISVNSTELETIEKRTRLVFDHNATPKPASGELKAARDLIKTLCRLNVNDIRIAYPSTFTRLIQTTRQLSLVALTQIYNRAGSLCSTGKKHMIDALPYLGSNAAVTIMRDTILSHRIPESIVHEWLFALSLIPSPDEETLELILPLVYHPKAQNESQYLLSISTLFHSYCRQHPDCTKSQIVQKFANYLEKEVDVGCSQEGLRRHPHDKLIVILKSLGNTGFNSKSLLAKLNKCVENELLNMDIRVEAIRSYRRIPCSFNRDYLLDIFGNITFDTEQRIAAYIEVMRCPNYFTINAIRSVLENEEVNQVGSFVWSHLLNILKSSMPTKVEVQSLITDKHLSEKFNMDRRKFSRNYDYSVFFDQYNVGGNVESNVIFSPDTYVPRSGMLNLTVDIFGESINIFEMSTRVEGFEHLLEFIFGPKAPFSSTQVNKKLEKIRFTRSADDEENSVVQKADSMPNVINTNFKTPKMSAGFKIFGNEFLYKSIIGHSEFSNLLDRINPEARIKQLLSGKELKFEKAGLFFDADYAIPTGSGFPVMLSALGTAAVRLSMVGNVKSLELLDLDVEGKFRPSAAIDVTGQMSVDAYYASTGIKLKTSLYSSTAIEGQVKVSGPTNAKISFKLPQEKVEIITAQSELIVMKGDKEEPQEGITENRISDKICSWPALDQALGLKLCLDFAYPNASFYLDGSAGDKNLTNGNGPSSQTPSLVLSGPGRFALALYKADPTANEYVLEYEWQQEKNISTILLKFDTPNSRLHRELSAKIVVDKLHRNLTVLFRGSNNTFEAHGTYKYTPTEKYLDVSLDVNGKKRFIAQVGLRRRDLKNGFLYQPKLYIAVNEERIAELSGSVRVVEKNDINHCSVDLAFQTKKVSMELSGYIRRGISSFSSNLTLSYQFTTKEYIILATKLVNKSTQNLNHFLGELSVQTTAYKHFNFESSLNFQRAQGHAECKIEVSTEPNLKDESHKFTIKLVFSLAKSYDRTKLHTFVEITKPSKEIDIKLEFKTDISHNGLDDKSRSKLLLRHAAGREILATLDLSVPRTDVIKLDMKLNVTITFSSFVPMIFTFKIDEKKHNEYDIESSGTWFSGHTMSAKGYYIDKSEGVVDDHNLKLILASPSFSEVSVTGKLLMDDTQFKFDIQADHENDKYAIVLKRAVNTPNEMELYGEVRYKSSLYSLGTIINLLKKRQVLIELHLDQHRDIHIALSAVNIPTHKEGGIEVKWDANRDPSQKFEAVGRFLHPRSLNYSADFLVHYPGRDINGMVLFAIMGTVFDSGFRVEWSPTDLIDVKLGAVYKSSEGKSLRITSQLLTPFPGWKRTSFIGGILRKDNLLRVNGSVWWQDNQTVSLDIYGNYDFKYEKKEIIEDYSDLGMFLYADLPELWVEFNASLISTVAEVKPMSAAFIHRQNHNKFDTIVHLKGQVYNETVLVRVDSSWELNQSPNATDIIGTVHLVSPYQGLERGKLVGKLHFTTDLDIQGVAELDLDRRKYAASIDGYVKSIRENMLVISVNTPIANYSKISGRIGYSESKRYLTCLWESPSNSIGFEILLDFQTSSNFDLLFLVATPLDFFSKLLLHGKLKPQTADFRIGFNNLLLGFDGFWRYTNIFDFDYKYRLLTPLEGFKENALAAKIIYKKNVDVELGLKVADVKIGVLLLCGRKSTSLIPEDEELLKWEGKIELDTYFYPTIKGDLDVDETEYLYTIDGNLMLPYGKIKLYDLLNFEDVFTITNNLRVNTTFASLEELNSEFKWLIYLGEYYIIGLGIDLLMNDTRNKGNFMVNYTVEAPEPDPYAEEEEIIEGPITRRITIEMSTPWEVFPFFLGSGFLEYDENICKSNLSLRTDASTFAFFAYAETDEGFTDSLLGLELSTPNFKIPSFKLSAKRDFAGSEKTVDVALSFMPPLSKVYHAEGSWNFDLPNLLKVRGKLHTPIEYIRHIEIFTSFLQQPEERQISVESRLSYLPDIDLKFSGLKKDKSIIFEADTPIDGFRKLNFNGTVTRGLSNEYNLAGKLIADKRFYTLGGVFENTQYPLSMRIELIPSSEGLRTAHIEVLVKRTDTGHELNSHFRHGPHRIDCSGAFEMKPNTYYRLTTSISTSHPDFEKFYVSGVLSKKENGRLNLQMDGVTPWTGSDNIHATLSYLKLEKNGSIKGNFTVPDLRGSMECDYTWLFMEHMALKFKGDYVSASEGTHVLAAEGFYRNPDRSLKFLSLGIDTNVDNAWSCGANATFLLPVVEDIKIAMNLKLPPPLSDIHSLMGKLRYANKFAYVAHTLQYTNEVDRAIYGTSGEISNNGSEIQGNMKFEWGNRPNSKSVTNSVLLLRNTDFLDFQYNLHTPYYKEDTVLAKMSSFKRGSYYDIKCELYKPKSNKLSSGSVRFMSIYNMNGTVNTTTPFKQVPYGATNFQIISQQGERFKRFVEVSWPNNTAFFDSDYTDRYTNEEGIGLVRRLDGKLLVELPLTTRHVGDVRYGYEGKSLEANGYCLADYNKKRMLDGKYKCMSTVRAGFDEDVVDMSLENIYFPLGIHYTHQFEYSGGNEGTNLPTIDKKFGQVFHLRNQSSFGLEGNLEIKTTHTGKDIKVKAIHANRTVQVRTEYNFYDHRFEHSSWISLDPQVWTSYDLHIVNKTTINQDEEHAALNISYPKRNFTVNGFFRSDKKRYEGEITLDWDGPTKPKSVGTSLNWRRISKKPDQQVLTVCLKHPSFEKDVAFNGTYIRHGSKSLLGRLEADYSSQIHKKLILESKIQDLSSSDSIKYTIDVIAQHPATKLDLLAGGEYIGTNGFYHATSDIKYKRSFLSLQHGTFDGKINSNDREIDFRKSFQKEESYFWAKYKNDESCCTRLNGSVAKTDSLNYTGDFFVDVKGKIIEVSMNMTPDASEKFRVFGSIPDSRNAMLNVWRDYEGEIISDIASFVRFNHSRLIISRIHWRPTLQKEVTSGIEYIFTSILRHLDETVDYWKLYTRSEIKDAVHDIWQNAKPDVQHFLNDLEELKALEQDFEEFKQFLNDSYENNDFYVKDITGATVMLLDELALKGHIQSLPDIINEIWQVMGNSGGAIRESILWIVETIKTSYLKAVEFIKSIWRGDSTEKITALFENLLQKYDKWIKDLQVTVLRHIEQMWNNFLSMMSQYWDTLVKTVEPTFIQFLHYVETVVWQASNEIINFLYERKIELVGSTYFTRLSNFTHDLDEFYRDVKENNVISSIKKYSKKIYVFLKEKYLVMIPFAKEIEEIADEIVNEFKELNKLPSINYLTTKTLEIYEKFIWLCESMDLEAKLESFINLVHTKITDVTHTALEADSRYRTAKTKFIFDPEEGFILLEQKLPMTWHAFNETPKFEEIPEYRAIAEFQNFLTFSNKTLWSFYYDYKPYLELNNWLPPFSSHAIIAGHQFIMTFDKKFYEFRGSCEYLLARDFVSGNFSLVMTKVSDMGPEHFILTLISNGIPISVDIFSDVVKMPKGMIHHLPAEIGNLYLYKEAGVLTIEEKDAFTLRCNLLFKVCTLEFSGWYYGKTAGLLGTMDHEKNSDYLTSEGFIEEDVGKFANSWALDRQNCNSSENLAQFIRTDESEKLYALCSSLFASKYSPFSTCFTRLKPEPFMKMCLNARKSNEKEDICTTTVAYTEACHHEYVDLPIPDFCIQCATSDGVVPEGEYFEISGDKVPQSADVVFIIEAKECNADLVGKRSFNILLSTLSKELNDVGLIGNRYGAVIFGGSGVYNKPRTLMMNQSAFGANLLTKNFKNFPVGNGDEDIFEAIAFASHMEFRTGVSKIFIVIPCSNCDPSNMTVEYSALREVLIEGNIKLHILINSEFLFEKQRIAKIFFGMDWRKAFTKKDFKNMQGDSELRRQAKLPKSIMGYCAPLALETNGTIFTAKKLESEKKNAVKKFISVFAKRVAQYAAPSPCQKCECSRYESGMSYMDCRLCEYPAPVNIDLCFNEYICMDPYSDNYDELVRYPDDHLMESEGDSTED